jgi:hypothetical protein
MKMGPLAEYLKNEADHLRAEEGKREEAKAEWLEALERLYNQLEQWALEADGGLRLLRVDRPVGEYEEPRLGVYDIPILRLRLGSRSVRVTPLARYVIAAIRPLGKEPQRPDGMVEIQGSSIAEYYLFRVKEEAGDSWFIQGIGEWNRQPISGKVEPLTRNRFEEAIVGILQ